MDVRSRVEHERTKAFYELLVERLGEEAWAERKAAYVKRIRDKDALFNVKFPVEPQLFAPPEDDIDWYILASHLSHTFPYSDSAYSSRRVYPYAMAIGAVARQLRNVPNVNDVLDKMLACSPATTKVTSQPCPTSWRAGCLPFEITKEGMARALR